MLRSIGKQSGKSVESFVKKKRKDTVGRTARESEDLSQDDLTIDFVHSYHTTVATCQC